MDSLRYAKPHCLPNEVFRAYDVRGIVDKQLNEAMIYHLGLAVGTQIRRLGEASAAVAADGRLSSPRLSQALIAGLVDTGCHVMDLGAAPTPRTRQPRAHLEKQQIVLVKTIVACNTHTVIRAVISTGTGTTSVSTRSW